MQKLEYKWRRTMRGMKDNILSLRLLVGAAVVMSLLSSAVPANARNDAQDEKKAQQQQNKENQNSFQQARRDNQAAQNQAQNQAAQNQRDNRANRDEFNRAVNQTEQANKANWSEYHSQERAVERANNEAKQREQQATEQREKDRTQAAANQRANERERTQAEIRFNNHEAQANSQSGYHPDTRWDYKLNNRDRYQSYKKYRNNWSEQRSYLKSNLSRFNQLANLDQQQQSLVDSQMRAAYLQYQNNQYNGDYNWNNYSDPRFIDYMRSKNPSLLQRILSSLGLGQDDDYLYSSNWSDERSELTQNMAKIHQLALEGRISRYQERALLNQMRTEFMDYHHNNWNGSVGWSQYADPGFVDYLNRKRPSILMTVRDYLVR